MEKIAARLEGLKTETLKDMAEKLFVDSRDGAEIVFSEVLDVLMARMPEDEFVAFVEAIN